MMKVLIEMHFGCGLEDGLWLRRGVGWEATSTTPY